MAMCRIALMLACAASAGSAWRLPASVSHVGHLTHSHQPLQAVQVLHAAGSQIPVMKITADDEAAAKYVSTYNSARRIAAVFLAGVLASGSFPLSDLLAVGAAEVTKSSEPYELEQLASKAEKVPVRTYMQQISDAKTIQTMRGVWRLREYGDGGKLVSTGTLTFRGDGISERGRVTYEGEAVAGRGDWLIRADGFAPSTMGKGGAIEQKALWGLRRTKVGFFEYSGRVKVRPGFLPGDLREAIIDGDIIEYSNGGRTKGGAEKKVGRFEAERLRLLRPEEETAAAAGEVGKTLELKAGRK